MSVGERDDAVELVGECGLDDAEPLLRRLLTEPAKPVDVTRCVRLHTAVVQVLLAARPEVRGPFAGGFFRTAVEPVLQPR